MSNVKDPFPISHQDVWQTKGEGKIEVTAAAMFLRTAPKQESRKPTLFGGSAQ